LVNSMRRHSPVLAAAITAAFALLSAAAPAGAQVFTNGPITVKQGAPGTVPWPVTQGGTWTFGLSDPIPAGSNAIGSVLADLRISGAAVSAANPIFAQITNLPNTQAVSGTVTVNQGTSPWAIAAASLPLPTGAATAALQSNVQSAPGTAATTLLGVQGATNGVPIPVTGTFFQPTQPVSSTTLATAANQNSTAAGTSATNAQGVQGVTGGVPLPIQGGNATAVKTDSSATTQPISAAALPLPTGAATATNQNTANATLGAPADAAYAGSGNASLVAALKGLYSIESQRSFTYTEYGYSAVGASQSLFGSPRSPAGYTRVNAWAGCTQSGASLLIQGSNDGFATTAMIVSSTAITANSTVASGTPVAAGASASAPVTFTTYRVTIANGATAGNCTLYSSLTTN
jgi:hypothetical protein